MPQAYAGHLTSRKRDLSVRAVEEATAEKRTDDGDADERCPGAVEPDEELCHGRSTSLRKERGGGPQGAAANP